MSFCNHLDVLKETLFTSIHSEKFACSLLGDELEYHIMICVMEMCLLIDVLQNITYYRTDRLNHLLCKAILNLSEHRRHSSLYLNQQHHLSEDQ